MYNTIRNDGFTNAPACPSSHPVRMPQVTFETVWDTTKFNSLWQSGAPNPFVWSFEGTGVSHTRGTLLLALCLTLSLTLTLGRYTCGLYVWLEGRLVAEGDGQVGVFL